MRSFYSFYLDATKIALQSIFAHKMRAFLTLIGIIIGVASVVVVGASINGLNTYVTTQISKVLGVNHFMIARMASVGHLTDEEWDAMNKRNKPLRWDDMEWLQHQCSTCTEIGAQANTSQDLKYEGQDMLATQIAGVTANMAQIEDKNISEGRFILTHEVERSDMVCVLGADVREKFFSGMDPIGKTLKIRDLPMTIVGVEEKRGSMFGNSMDNHVYIPLTMWQKMFGTRQSLFVHGKAESRERFEATLEQARVQLRNKHKLKGNQLDDFSIVDDKQVTSQIDQMTGAISGVVVPVTFISLLVGGIVVMNIMLVSVTERTFEIGLRKSLGARRKHILMQFLIESSLLSSFGGLFGLLLAAGISFLISNTTPVPMTITPAYVLISLIVSGGIGMIFGIYPAMKAAKLDPIIALTKTT
ncbi:MAG TPA: ABC transporter permease [Blastocatellia bacterium]|nr:ABC transporter permease [Blastocatellia bacterium]